MSYRYRKARVCYAASLLALTAAALPQVSVAQRGEQTNSLLLFEPRAMEIPSGAVVEGPDGVRMMADPYPTLFEAPVNASFLGRAAALSDSTRMAGFAGDGFLPAAIPVAGQAFFNSGYRANLQGSGSAVGVSAVGQVPTGAIAGTFAQILVRNASLAATDTTANPSVSFQQAFGRLNRLRVGLMESAFADPAAVPDTLDVAGPNARTTVYPAGLGDGQGRISYDLFSDTPDGFKTTLSLEQPTPLIPTDDTTGTFSRTPDFVCAFQFVEGDYEPISETETAFYERWHIQFGTLFRDLGLEDSTNTFRENAFGYGLSLSGAFRFVTSPCLETLDKVSFSVTYGEGISRYITDLNAAPDTNDAIVNTGSALVPLPVLAWYAGYTHNWTDFLRSTVTYSQVDLDSVTPLAATAPPYRVGEYVAVNLLYHSPFQTATADGKKDHNFFTGIEYLYGHKETLSGAAGDANRLMWLVAISN